MFVLLTGLIINTAKASSVVCENRPDIDVRSCAELTDYQYYKLQQGQKL